MHEPEALPYIPDQTPSRSPSPSQRTHSPSPAHSTQSCPTDFRITRHAIPSYQLNPSPALQFPSFAAEDNLPDSRYNSPTQSPSPTLETPSSVPSTSQNSNLETPFPSDPSSPINPFPGSPSIIPPHRMTTLATGRAAMPAPDSNHAPKTFDGSKDDITDFLELFENCVDDAQLPDKEKVAFIFRYLSRGQKNIFKMLEGYAELDWIKFKMTIEEAFEGAFKEKKYTPQSLIQFTWNNATLPIQTNAELRAYQRGFQAITHYLIKEQIITEDEHDHYYCKAYKSTDVFRASKYLFDVDTFDRNPPEGFAPPDSESKPQGGSVEVMTRTVTLLDTPMSAPVSQNMEDLLLRIRSLNVREPEYPATYAKIQAASPITADLLKQ
ncbi:hypothetical protein M422DRAFT_239030 [Sphaerobolus stellatus SS14]|nr:hypothetical protein M422DRAFT_239030 [Sphaerobolus stellatus SS14]